VHEKMKWRSKNFEIVFVEPKSASRLSSLLF